MVENINGNFSFSLSENVLTKNSTDKNQKISFTEMFRENINRVNNLHKEADMMAEKLALGEIDNIHEVTIAAEKARTAINLTSAIQSKVVQSYEEIMRMQV